MGSTNMSRKQFFNNQTITKMPAVSQAQSRYMHLVKSYQEGKTTNVSDKVKETAKGMSPQQVGDFTKTKTKDLPEKVEKDAFVILPSWGGGETKSKRHLGMRGRAGYSYAMGILPIPHVGVSFGGDNHEVGISGPIPGLSLHSGDHKNMSGYEKDMTRSAYKLLSDKAHGRTKTDHVVDLILERAHKELKMQKDNKKGKKKTAFETAFIKRAEEYGFPNDEANDLFKWATEVPGYHKDLGLTRNNGKPSYVMDAVPQATSPIVPPQSLPYHNPNPVLGEPYVPPMVRFPAELSYPHK